MTRNSPAKDNLKKLDSDYNAEAGRLILKEKQHPEKNGDLDRLKTENSELKKKIRELEISGKKYSVLAELAPVGIFNADAKGNTVYVNPYWCQITQINYEEALGNGWMKVVHPEDIDILKVNWEKAVSNRSGSYAEYRFKRSDGTIAWVIGNSVPEFYANGKLAGFVGTITDITERKLAEEKAEESDRLKSSFLNNISHEIRTPLNAITGFCAFLSDPDLPADRRDSFIKIITESSDYLLSIITDIIDIAAIESGHIVIEEEETNINYILEVLYGRFLKRADERGNELAFVTSMPDDKAWVITDKSKLNQSLNNLLSNALKFTENGKVEFGYSRKEKELEFFVKDTGIGIHADMHEEIFKRFRQVELLDNRRYGGSGIGLAITKAYIEMLGGSVRVESLPGKGSSFFVTIPFKRP